MPYPMTTVCFFTRLLQRLVAELLAAAFGEHLDGGADQHDQEDEAQRGDQHDVGEPRGVRHRGDVAVAGGRQRHGRVVEGVQPGVDRAVEVPVAVPLQVDDGRGEHDAEQRDDDPPHDRADRAVLTCRQRQQSWNILRHAAEHYDGSGRRGARPLILHHAGAWSCRLHRSESPVMRYREGTRNLLHRQQPSRFPEMDDTVVAAAEERTKARGPTLGVAVVVGAPRSRSTPRGVRSGAGSLPADRALGRGQHPWSDLTMTATLSEVTERRARARAAHATDYSALLKQVQAGWSARAPVRLLRGAGHRCCCWP